MPHLPPSPSRARGAQRITSSQGAKRNCRRGSLFRDMVVSVRGALMHREVFGKNLSTALVISGCLAALVADIWDARYVLVGALMLGVLLRYAISWGFLWAAGGRARYQV